MIKLIKRKYRIFKLNRKIKMLEKRVGAYNARVAFSCFYERDAKRDAKHLEDETLLRNLKMIIGCSEF